MISLHLFFTIILGIVNFINSSLFLYRTESQIDKAKKDNQL